QAIGVAVAISGLQPDTAYRYRAVATSHCSVEDEEKVCEDAGADQAFHTYPIEAPGLPDNRAYELVSPVLKHGGEVFPADPTVRSCVNECKPGVTSGAFPRQSSPDGEAVVYEGFSFALGKAALNENEYLSQRTAAGWQTTFLSPQLQERGSSQGY